MRAEPRRSSQTLRAPANLSQCLRRPITSELDRRRFLGWSAFASASFLAGCSASPGREAAPENRTVRYDYESFTGRIPADPQRVLVIEGRADLEFALTCGYPVFASGFYFGQEGALLDEMQELMPADLETIGFADSGEPDHELIASLGPDLIIMRQNAYSSDFYGNSRLEEVAPVLAVESGSTGWQDAMREQARMLERDEAVDEEIARYNELTETIRERSGEELSRMSLICGTAMDTAGMLVITNSLGNEVATDLGIEVPMYDPTDEEGSYELSEENLGDLADVGTLAVFAFEERPALGQSEAFRRLPAAQNERVFNLDLTLNQGLARAACALARQLEEMAAPGGAG
ncbi:ABC transporter substrate-binding protein [Nesterenkonia sp. NBAIMH1]|uniref:ABC transporter substrate-binding protein n=1 Tax=Nesterenkonia sp. NBAIMH1 TaxID=2600320 RepID=UPI0011B56CBF|nr:ABC transporter substrate-binding protein [Nesterenkonia sp. NBAIMH1]